MMLTILLAASAAVYLVQMLLLRFGLGKNDRIQRSEQSEPVVTVIVAARNEEHCIHECMKSLSELDYPSEKLEIIIVNDGSTDRTAEIIQQFIHTRPLMRMITARHLQDSLRGKANAVAQGIDASRGDILMLTDADCTVPKTWVRETVTYFRANVGIVGGFTLLEATTMFETIQALDWIFLFGIASATAGWGKPLTVIGNNLSIRRSAYEATGGYRRIPFSVTEDYALVHAVISMTNYEIVFPLNRETLVRSRGCQNFTQLFRQKQRWGVGGLDMVLRGMIIMSIGCLLRVMLLISLISVHYPVIAASAACMCFIDLRFLWNPLKRFGALAYMRYFFLFEFYYLIYVPLIPIVALLSKKIIWKERRL